MNFEKGSTNAVRNIVKSWITDNLMEIADLIECGLPEYDDRLKVWRITIKPIHKVATLGEIQVDQEITKVVDFTNTSLVIDRLQKISNNVKSAKTTRKNVFIPAPIPNKVILQCKNRIF